ncbi:MAG TPA: DUF2075 domain-containing protein [Spirochaetia bacterium]|nr:DUF2075 domain-containing protein [Spirochaetia bacterium]
MRLYVGTSEQFIQDNVLNQIAEKLKNTFFGYYRYYPSPSEVSSWRNSLRTMSQMIQYADLLDNGVILEYQLPLTSKRLDCLISGRDTDSNDSAVIVELKQWEGCQESNGENEVVTWIGGHYRDVLHPSVQVGQYNMYLQDTHTAFYEGENPVRLNSCTYLHNYNYYSDDVIFSRKFTDALQKYPLFTADDVPSFKTYLSDKLSMGNGMEVLNRIEKGEYRPSKKLMEHIGNTIKGKSEYILLDEQLVVYDKVLACVKDGFHDKQKAVFIIKGGPGTGKSVIALNLVADLLLSGYNAHYATGSKAFTETLRKIMGTRSPTQFKYFNSYSQCAINEIDVLICDEAHRIRESSNSFYTPKGSKSNIAQIQEILKAAKSSVFFIDDAQVVRPNEVGSVQYIKHHADTLKCRVLEYELEAQFRCSGSDGFVNWVDNTLGIRRTANILWNQKEESFDLKIMGSPEMLEDAIREMAENGFTARMTAGFCWRWSKTLTPEGRLHNDVVVGNYARPWNAHPDATGLPRNIPKASYWAYDHNGIGQVGCVYTAQGFEFDYVGVIVGNDLKYSFEANEWQGFPEKSYDTTVKRSKDQFVDLVKNTYRVLFTRGLKGCYVYFMDKDSERFFRSRME